MECCKNTSLNLKQTYNLRVRSQIVPSALRGTKNDSSQFSYVSEFSDHCALSALVTTQAIFMLENS
jgi:hypothetical protein